MGFSIPDHSRRAVRALRRRRAALALAPLAVTSSVALTACSSGPPPETAAQLLNAGINASTQGNYNQARSDYRGVIQKDPNNSAGIGKVAWYDLGVLDQKLGHVQEARSEYQQAILFDPKYVNAIFNLAVLETGMDAPTAIGLYREVLALAPNDPNTQYNLGLLLYETGQVTEGRALLKSAIAIAPSLAAKLPSSVKLTP